MGRGDEMGLRQHEIAMADEIASRVAARLRDGKTSQGGDVRPGLRRLEGLRSIGTPIPYIPDSAASDKPLNKTEGVPCFGETALEDLAAVTPDEFRAASLAQEHEDTIEVLTAALEQSAGAITGMQAHIETLEGTAQLMCDSADAAVHALLVASSGSQLPTPTVVRLRKLQQRCDALQGLIK